MKKKFVFQDLGEVISITTDLEENGSFRISYLAAEDVAFSEKYILKDAEGRYFIRTLYQAVDGKEWWGDAYPLNLEDYPEPACAVRDCGSCRAAVICRLEAEEE